MRANGRNASLTHDNDQVSPTDLGKAVGDDKGGSAFGSQFYGLLDLVFGFAVNRAGGVIQDQDLGVGQECPGKRKALPLTAGNGPPLSPITVS